jgi:hypothetical protein
MITDADKYFYAARKQNHPDERPYFWGDYLAYEAANNNLEPADRLLSKLDQSINGRLFSIRKTFDESPLWDPETVPVVAIQDLIRGLTRTTRQLEFLLEIARRRYPAFEDKPK